MSLGGDNHQQMNECLTISLQGLIASGFLSTCTFSLESGKCNDEGSKGLCFVNAARLSLLLTRTLSRLIDGRCVDPTSLSLEDFVVKLACSSNVSEIHDIPSDNATQDEAEPVIEKNDMLPLDFNVDPLDINNIQLDLLSNLLDMNNDSCGHQRAEIPLEASEEEGASVWTDQCSAFGTEDCDERSFSWDIDKFQKINAANGSDTHWILLGVEVRDEKKSSQAKSLEELTTPEALKNIGRMILEVFSTKDGRNLPATFKRSLVLDEDGIDNICNAGDDLEHHFSKLQRRDGKSLFSVLVEDGYFPVSVCRLVADMIDIGIDGLSDFPFASLDEVIEDLEQMSSCRQVHLDDLDGFSSNLRFGLGCYGRKDQVTEIIRVASNIEGDNGRETPHSVECVDCVFVSGIAGSGKSFLVQSVAKFLTETCGCLVFGARFEDGIDCRGTVYSVFDNIVASLVGMRDGGVERDVEYSRRARKAISESLDASSLSSLANFLPSLEELFNIDEGLIADGDAADSDKGSSLWRQVYLLSSLLGAIVLLDRKVLLYFDDLQSATQFSLALICEIAISMGRLDEDKHFLLIGMYRDNEVTDSHPFTVQYDALKRNKHVNVTDINLPSLSKKDVTIMVMTEIRLPRRIVQEFSDFIYRKTSGHALFVIQLLNSLVRDSVVIYSPLKKRYTWDTDRLVNLPTWDSVAGFIVSNLSSLTPGTLSSLRVLSFLGLQVHSSMIDLIGGCTDLEGADGIVSSIPILVDACILESCDTMIRFSHALIHERVYQGLSVSQREQIHLIIGKFIGSMAAFEFRASPTDCGEGHYHEGDAPSPQSLVSVATDHINNASQLVVEPLERACYAGWNLCAAKQSAVKSNFPAALSYSKNGISFLGSNAWNHNVQHLSYGLFKTAAYAMLALGEPEKVPQYTNAITKNVPFNQSFEAQALLIRSLESQGSKNSETIATALAVLRRLEVGFDIPSAPRLYLSYILGGVRRLCPSVVKQSMRKTDRLSSRYNLDDLIDQRERSSQADITNRNILSICDSVMLAGLRLRSPYVPVIICESINFSLEQDSICGESALSFCYFGYMKIWLEEKFDEGSRWGALALKILEKAKNRSPFVRTRYLLYHLVLHWKRPLRESVRDLFETYEMGMKYGDVASASLTLQCYLRWSFFNGEKLSTIRGLHDRYLKQIAKYNKEAAKAAILDKSTVDFLMGEPCDSFSIFDGMICDETSLLADALSKKNFPLVMQLKWYRFYREFWMENYSEARRWGKEATKNVGFSGPLLFQLFEVGARGVTAFQLYKEGKGDTLFNEGKELLDELEAIAKNISETTVKSKLLLLRAEYFASNCEVKKAKQAYKESIRCATTYGHIPDQAIGYEMMGRYLTSILEIPEANEAHKNGYCCYMRWGAVLKAKKIQEHHSNLDFGEETNETNSLKHRRGW